MKARWKVLASEKPSCAAISASVMSGRASNSIAASRRIGKVMVDHGETDCKTPDAEPYILKARARAKEKAAKKATK